MADIQSTQTRPEFQYRFLALGISSQGIVHIIATTEREAREHSPDGHVMVFAGRLPVQGGRHV
ncbi:host cell division inhibitor Icd-like protein [Pectobacterium parmentieri]|uniref:host cell division inhibitor Icd-like protein n=1 Tax=Pectobacterium parmentieri TaxID=1905730 RepID=UPI000CDE2EC5|nr:host cell division inhibitor Icd-like protein [Pectobacterium parmentieri]AYH04134.1 host cell division inhibitor Icd-like protein [Pectobacterium parmentieri]AYH12955.1 host cell division inhibitor Icd-like protein [Pectobacterium parmentieri]AYH21657.1 host cell division inhibitor Icd-like protein [Pectobacterium parmentieri]MBN3177141.1 host cell division inhibitor Icd-like protein [Pectobacterium parmentieri]POW25016.1 Icd-like protein [Pectobacterium parmentieri]